MRVIISVGGRFHGFNLAEEMEKRGALQKLITSYPKFFVERWGIPREKVNSILLREIIERGHRKLPRFLRDLYRPTYLVNDLFDRLAARHVEPTDIFVAWAGEALESIRKAKKQGAITIVERGSSHVLFQQQILKEEHEKFGRKWKADDPRLIDKELKEYEEADYISLPSSFNKRTFLERGFPEEKIIQIPYGVKLDVFRQLPKTDNKFRVIFAGGMSLRKGTHYLLRTFEELNLPNAELMLIGSMNEEIEPFFKQYEGTFNYVGHVPQPELHKYYSEGSVFVMPSIEEGLAMVQFQAMACGLPVIATTNTGGEDIVRDGQDGFIIPIRNVEALKEKILYLYEHEVERAAMGESAKQRVASGFTWNDYGDKMFAAYERVFKI